MHSSLVRAQNVFGFFTTVAFCVAAVTALSVLLAPQTPRADIALRNVQVIKGRPNYYSSKKEEYAHIKFDLDADFTSLFNWNTKQLFVWVAATYPSTNATNKDAPRHEAVIWDMIINSKSQRHPLNPLQYFQSLRKPAKKSLKTKKTQPKKSQPEVEPGIISVKNIKPKYQITDVRGKLAETKDVKLQVGWNVQPWVGALTWTQEDGQNLLRWKGVKGGRSKTFELPPLKGKSASSATVVSGGEAPPAAKAAPIV